MPIRVLIVDDSAVARQALARELSRDPELEVATAPDALVARDRIVSQTPDVVLLDIEMPRMDGITFLKKLMRHHPLPVIIVSSLTAARGALAVEALAAGAVDVLKKPGPGDDIALLAQELTDKVKAFATAKPEFRGSSSDNEAGVQASPRGPRTIPRADQIVAIGASTGGTQALQGILTALPKDSPPIVVVQHMPEHFTRAFAERLNRLCVLEISEAKDGDPLEVGRVFIAPGDKHLLVVPTFGGHIVQVREGPPVNRHRPSVDVLFRSVARAVGPRALGILLTGMGADGAKGLKELRDSGAATIAQDAATCVVFGMPQEAIRLGAACQVLPLGRIAEAISG